jgi:hypothetical protein
MRARLHLGGVSVLRGLLRNTGVWITRRFAHLVHSSIRSSISVDVGLANLSEDSPVKSFVAEDEAPLAVTVALLRRV